MNHIRAKVTLLAASALVLAACGSSSTSANPPASNGRGATPSPSLEATEAAETAGTSNLAMVVVSPDLPPPGMRHDRTAQGPHVLTRVVISGSYGAILTLDGFVDGRYTEFSGEAGALLSLGLAYETASIAEISYGLYLRELRSEAGYGFSSALPADLGDEGVCGVGPNRAHGGLVESICLWRRGTLVLMAGGPIPAPDLASIAAAMDARAVALASPLNGTAAAEALMRL